MGENLASAIVCCNAELQQLRKRSSIIFPPDTLVNFFDRNNNSIHEASKFCLQALKQRLESHNNQSMVTATFDCDYDEIFWPIVPFE